MADLAAAHADLPRADEWLLIEWPLGEEEPTHYVLSTLPATRSCKALVATVKMRWRIERDYLELKQEVGLGQYDAIGAAFIITPVCVSRRTGF